MTFGHQGGHAFNEDQRGGHHPTKVVTEPKQNAIEKPDPFHVRQFQVGDTIRMPHYPTAGGPALKRVWKIVGCYLGGNHQEGTYRLVPLDYLDNEPIHVPCVMLETHQFIERV